MEIRRDVIPLTAVVAILSAGGLALGEVPASQPQPSTPSVESARPGTGGGPPPPYSVVRWNEDYSYLKDPARRGDFFDPIKYVPFNEKGDWYASFGGQARYRYELYNNANFGAGPQDNDGYSLTRLLAHADVHLGPAVRGFFQARAAMIDGRNGGPRPTDSDEFDLQQGFVDLKLPLPFGAEGSSVTFRGGRQELVYGAQRLIGALDWANVQRTFDGGKAIVQFSKTHSLDLFWVHPVIVENEEPNPTNGHSNFGGAYDTIGLPGVFGKAANSKLDVYGLFLVRTDGAYPNEAGNDEDRYTIGARFNTTPKPFDLDVEADYQFGTFGSGDISAWAFAVEGGYTFAAAPMTPRLFVGFDSASGDQTPGDGHLQTFNQLFPTGHPFFGYIDVVGRQNIIDVHPGAEITPLHDKRWAKKVTLRGEYHTFWRESGEDALYNDAGAVQRADVAGVDDLSVGSALDFLLNWQIDRHAATYFGYSHFFAGDFIEKTGPSQDIDFFYAAITYTF
jgi:hypothetical protein